MASARIVGSCRSSSPRLGWPAREENLAGYRSRGVAARRMNGIDIVAWSDDLDLYTRFPITTTRVGMTMGCSSCADHPTEYEEKAAEVLGLVGLREVFQRGDQAAAEAGRALTHLNRAERTTALGFASDVAAVHAAAAARCSQRAQQQAQAVLAQVDQVAQGDEWDRHVEKVRAVFEQRGGEQMLADLRDDVRLQLLDADPGLNANNAELVLTLVDSGIKAASAGDLNEIVGYMRKVMQAAAGGYASPEMGRQPIGLGLFDDGRGDDGPWPVGGGADIKGWCIALGACIAWAISSLVASMVVCFVYIGCAASFWILLAFGAHFNACFLIFANLCSQQ